MTAGDGSAFLPYGQGVAAYLAKKDIRLEIKKSGGSNDNLIAVDASPMTIGKSLAWPPGKATPAIVPVKSTTARSPWAAGRTTP